MLKWVIISARSSGWMKYGYLVICQSTVFLTFIGSYFSLLPRSWENRFLSTSLASSYCAHSRLNSWTFCCVFSPVAANHLQVYGVALGPLKVVCITVRWYNVTLQPMTNIVFLQLQQLLKVLYYFNLATMASHFYPQITTYKLCFMIIMLPSNYLMH